MSGDGDNNITKYYNQFGNNSSYIREQKKNNKIMKLVMISTDVCVLLSFIVTAECSYIYI